MHSLSAVLNPEFGRSWHEAVAVVQEAATLWQPGLSIPGPEDIFVDDEGVLSFGFGDESSENPVTALATLLQGLLKGIEAPSTLVDLASENAKNQPAHSSLSSFSKALAFFERPNRANDLRALAGRLQGFRETPSPAVEFERLREKVSKADQPQEKPEQPEKAKKRVVATRRQQAIAATVVGIVTLVTLGFRSGVRDGVGSFVAAAESGVQGVVSAGLTKLGVSNPPSNAPNTGAAAAAPPAGQPVELEKTAHRSDSNSKASVPVRTTGTTKADPAAGNPRNVSRNASKSASANSSSLSTVEAVTPPTPLPAASPAADSSSKAGPTLLPPLPPADPPKPSPAIMAPDGIFSSAYPDVKAPALMRQQLPREPAPGDDTGFFDMVIDEAGNVANIKLISPRRRYHDRMLVAAAKAWKFRPATLNGQPVKYRLRIPIILTGMP
jgi:hypothetical protein